MQQVLRLLMTAAFAGVIAFTLTTTGCSTECPDGQVEVDGECQEPPGSVCEKDPYDSECVCTRFRDCGRAGDWACNQGQCIRICDNSSVCKTGFVCENGYCVSPGCGNDSECGSGEQCIGGDCKPAVTDGQVASCSVLPRKAVLADGASKSFSVLAKDADGKVVPFKGSATWSTAGVAATVDAGVVTGGSAAGEIQVKASVGGTECDAASVANFEAAPNDKVRVVVADLNTSALIDGATVVVQSGGETHEADTVAGVALVDGHSAAEKTISVFHNDQYAYVTVAGVVANDVAVFLKPVPATGGFFGEMNARDFDNLPQFGDTVHLGIFGGSIPGNLIDLSIDTLLGEFEDTVLDLGGQTFEVPLPQGIVIGIADQMFRNEYTVLASPGVRAVWGIGGNVGITDVLTALGPVISGGTDDLDVGGILTQLLPLIGRLRSGALTGQNVVADQMTDVTETMLLTTGQRLRVNTTIPNLPEGFAAAIALGGAVAVEQGLIPMGLTAGLAKEGETVVENPEGGPDNVLPLRMAPLHSGLETGDYAVVVLAADLGGLLDDSGSDGGLALSGLIGFPGALEYKAEGANEFTFTRDFLTAPAGASLSGRTLSTGSGVAGAGMHRLDIGSEGDGEWFVFFPPSSSSVEVPAVPAGKADRMRDSAILQSVGFKSGVDFEGVFTLNGVNSDNLVYEIDAFSTVQVEEVE